MKVNAMSAVMLILNRYSILLKQRYLLKVVSQPIQEGFHLLTGAIFISEEKKDDKREPGGAIPEINFKTPNKLKQFIVFTKRDVLSKIADTQYLLITLLEAPVLAFFLAFLIRYFDESVKESALHSL